MRQKRYFFIISMAFLFIILLSTVAFADVGGFAGDSDYGGGWDTDWDTDWDSDWDTDWGTGDTDWDSDYSYEDEDVPIGGFGIIVIILLVLFLTIRKKSKNGSVKKPIMPGAVPTSAASLMPIAKLEEKDPNFSDAAMIEKISNLYVQMQNAWQEKDFEPMRANMTDTLYNQFARQLETGFIQTHLTNRVERIAVLGVDLIGFAQDDTNDTIVARVRTRIVDYVINDQTGAIVRGSNTRELFMEYEWTLIRSKNVKTPEIKEETVAINCKNCGAPMNINHSARCEYCGTVMTKTDYDWVISSIKGLSQRSGS